LALKSSASALVLKLYNAISNFGVEYVAGELDKINDRAEGGIDKELVDFITSICCRKYQVDQDEIRADYIRNGNAISARTMSVVLIKKHVHSYSNKRISKEMKKEQSFVTRVLKEYECMEGKVKHEREFLENYKDLNDQVVSYRKKTNVEVN